MVAPSDQNHFIFSPSLSYRTTHLPSPSNNNKTVSRSSHHHQSLHSPKPTAPHHSSANSPLIMSYSRKRSNPSPTLPPLQKQTSPRTRKGRTVPSSRANSSKVSRLELKHGKRSRSASEDPAFDLTSKELANAGRAQQITQTVRVLRARSALLLPAPSPQLNLPMPAPNHHPASLQVQPLILKSEERRKRR